jgi:hypothetical protein
MDYWGAPIWVHVKGVRSSDQLKLRVDANMTAPLVHQVTRGFVYRVNKGSHDCKVLLPEGVREGEARHHEKDS